MNDLIVFVCDSIMVINKELIDWLIDLAFPMDNDFIALSLKATIDWYFGGAIEVIIRLKCYKHVIA